MKTTTRTLLFLFCYIWFSYQSFVFANTMPHRGKGRLQLQIGDIGSIPNKNINKDGLTITSFGYQHNPEPVWVSRLFGEKSVYYGRSGVKGSTPLSTGPITLEELKERTQSLRRVFSLPEYALSPSCSITMYGVVLITDKNTPFDGNRKPYIGESKLLIESLHSWTCFYRPIYENWRSEGYFSSPNYRAVVWYCPAQNQTDCETMNAINSKDESTVRAQLSLRYEKESWNSSFSALVKSPQYLTSSGSRTATGVCTVIPYSSSDPRTLTANRAMLMEWIRHYTRLGMKVAVYDSFGKNKDYIFDSTDGYKIANSLTDNDGVIAQNLLYFDHTLHSLISPETATYAYDNTEVVPAYGTSAYFERLGRYDKQGNDKVLTLSHCRFEMKSRYGIDRVIVADPDEFLYCPSAKNSYKRQAKRINKILQDSDSMRFDQHSFQQYFVSNLTASVRQCVFEKVQLWKSVFDCFANSAHGKEGHSHKSVHLQHACPFTGYHDACSKVRPRSHDCVCTTTETKMSPFKDSCMFIHLSTKDEDYDPKKWPSYAIAQISDAVSELRDIHVNNY